MWKGICWKSSFSYETKTEVQRWFSSVSIPRQVNYWLRCFLDILYTESIIESKATLVPRWFLAISECCIIIWYSFGRDFLYVKTFYYFTKGLLIWHRDCTAISKGRFQSSIPKYVSLHFLDLSS